MRLRSLLAVAAFLGALCLPTPVRAQITPPTLVTNASSATDANSYSTASLSPSANSFHTMTIGSRLVGIPNQPTISGCSMTWTPIATLTSVVNSYRITVFRSATASPGSSCQLTADFAGQTQLDAWWFIHEWPNADTTGTNGSNGIAQSEADNEGGSSVTNPSITLSSFGDAVNNAAFACWVFASSGAVTAGTDFTLSGTQVLGSARSMACEYQVGEDTTADISWVGAAVTVGIAMEIKMEAAAGVVGSFVNGTPLKSLVGGGLAR